MQSLSYCRFVVAMDIDDVLSSSHGCVRIEQISERAGSRVRIFAKEEEVKQHIFLAQGECYDFQMVIPCLCQRCF